MSLEECCAEICTRMRACPVGTTGWLNATTYTPRRNISSAVHTAFEASANITFGMSGSIQR
ncbi:hypothetical protein ABIA39_004700 [Nocardia sp. GAS34]